jgi:predicted ATP-dependent endonuclease of OLD family
MKIKHIKIHNFRSIKDGEFDIENYSLLIGENNAGKSNVFRALRIFYEDNLKFDANSDFSKFETDDKESWIEIQYETDIEEQESLKKEYQSEDNILKVRKILSTEDSKFKPLVKANQSNIFAYENGVLSENYFYGAKNISQSKFGRIIFIPEISKVDDNLKMSGPSPLREMINFVVKKVIAKSDSFSKLNQSFEIFNNEFKSEDKDDFSIDELEKDINQEVSSWGINFGLNINPIKPADIVKNLVSHYVQDGNLGNKTVSIDSFGQGLQRHLIYTLLKLSAKYSDNTQNEKKKEFNPDLTFILFEEPEAFLHPSQQEKLNINLQKLSSDYSQQIIITTHSPIFVCRNINQLASLIKVNRTDTSKLFQISQENIDNLFSDNNGLFQHFQNLLDKPEIGDELKAKIRKYSLAREEDDIELKLEQERFKYALWLDSERTSLFFAKQVLICEGASEKVFIDYLLNNKWIDLKDKHLYVLDSLGKFNIHRFMNLFANLGIKHSVLMDSDENKTQQIVNEFIENCKNAYTVKIDLFDKDLEHFLGIPTPPRKDLKPLNIMYQYCNETISEEKIAELKEKIEKLIE